MDQESEMIKKQMEHTRASLTEKVEMLEQKVEDTVTSATTAVTETVESVKETVQGTVDSVKEAVQGTVDTVKETVSDTVETVKSTFDVRAHTQRHPWAVFGSSIAVGFLGGYLLGGRGRESHPTNGSYRSANGNGVPSYAAPPAAPAPAPVAEEKSHGLLGGVSGMFGSELSKLKGLAIGTTLGLVRDLLTRSMPPEVGTQLSEVIDGITTKLGGEPVRGSLLQGLTQDGSRQETGKTGI
jgi:ElaB/YqjD/DUF883 family membrane-anchored ribosome-binding protein